MNTTEEKNFYIIRQNVINGLNEQNLSGTTPTEEVADRLMAGFRRNAPREFNRLLQGVPA